MRKAQISLFALAKNITVAEQQYHSRKARISLKISTNRDDNAHLLRIVVTLVLIKHKRTKCDNQNDNLAKLWQDNLPLLELIAQISVAVEK